MTEVTADGTGSGLPARLRAIIDSAWRRARRRRLRYWLAAAAMIAACFVVYAVQGGDGGVHEPTGSAASASESNAVLAQRSCAQGGSANEVAAAARQQVPGRHPVPPQAALATSSSSECGFIVESAPPWYGGSVADGGMGTIADYAVKVRRGEPLMVAFGAPVRSAEAYLGPSHGCGIRLTETGDPSLYEVSLPDRIWTNPGKGCGRTGKIAVGIVAEYGEGSPFAGYTSQFAFSFTLAS